VIPKVTSEPPAARGRAVAIAAWNAGDVLDQVVRRQNEQAGVRLPALCVIRRHRDRRGGCAADRLEYLHLGLHSDLPQLLRDEKPVLVVRDDDRRTRALHALQPRYRVLKKTSIGDQRQELLRQQAPGHRPQAAARAAGEDQGPERGGHVCLAHG